MKLEYVNLHGHSEYSSLDGFARFEDIKDSEGNMIQMGIVSRLKEIGHTRCAITDHASLSAIQPAFGAFSAAGIQLLPGCEFYVVDNMKNQKTYRNHLVVIAKNKNGWQNILKMNYIGFEQGSKMIFDRTVATIDMSVLEKYSSDLVISSACLAGVPSHLLKIGEYDAAVEYIKKMTKLFPESYYLEVQGVDYYGMLDTSARTAAVDKDWIEMQASDQKLVNDRIIDIADKLKVPVVCTTDFHYVSRADRESHLLMLAVQSKKSIDTPAMGSGVKGGRLAFEATPLLATKELIAMFTETDSGFNGYPEYLVKEWVANTSKAADQCEVPNYLKSEGYKIPAFPVEESDDYSRFLKWKQGLDPEQVEKLIDDNADYLKSRLILG
jgi:DNA polymerase III alpha subunit